MTGHTEDQVLPKYKTAPECLLLASVVTKILYLGNLVRSIVVKHLQLMTIDFMASKACWKQPFHVGNFFSALIVVSSVNMPVYSARYLTKPRKLLASVMDFGIGQFMIWSAFLLSASIPHVLMWCPKKSISRQKKCVLSGLTYSHTSLSAFRTNPTLCSCSSIICNQITMSSK